MFGRQDQKCYPENGIDSGREGLDFAFVQSVLGNVKTDFNAFAAADPVALHGQDFVRPLFQRVKIQQLIRVVGDTEEPLLQIAAGYRCVAPFAYSVQHLLVGQDGLTRRTPDHRRFGAISQTLLVQFYKEPLVPAIVFGEATHHFAVPVIHRPYRTQLASHVIYVGHCPFVGMDTSGYRGIFRRQPEGVKTDRVQHVVPLHPPETGVGVRWRQGIPVTDVQVTRRIRVHRHLEPFGARIFVFNPIDTVALPTLLPLAIDRYCIEPKLNLPLARSHWKFPL